MRAQLQNKIGNNRVTKPGSWHLGLYQVYQNSSWSQAERYT